MGDIMRQFNEEMRAYVPLDTENVLEWIEVGQALRRGCDLAPTLFNIFSTVLNTAKKRF